MQPAIRKADRTDKRAVIDILNYYIENSFAAYPEKKVGTEFFDVMVQLSRGSSFYVVEDEGRVVGFGVLKKFQGLTVFNRAGEVGYFLMPEYTRKGIGSSLLKRLEDDARILGVETILASISSLNTESLAFHLKHGFAECGRFRRIGRKHGRDFDVVWMQKDL